MTMRHQTRLGGGDYPTPTPTTMWGQQKDVYKMRMPLLDTHLLEESVPFLIANLDALGIENLHHDCTEAHMHQHSESNRPRAPSPAARMCVWVSARLLCIHRKVVHRQPNIITASLIHLVTYLR